MGWTSFVALDSSPDLGDDILILDVDLAELLAILSSRPLDSSTFVVVTAALKELVELDCDMPSVVEFVSKEETTEGELSGGSLSMDTGEFSDILSVFALYSDNATSTSDGSEITIPSA
ncbi:DNA-binding protein, putative [Babesia ovis]|uniref:DNA-binding protein, putative n=1 Tax=Babesia ovis TaxID=5869 RepID=A0A9W5WVS8_BABOV|nr:DNA-binding protein, putative [Babesia ovis]